MIICYMVCFFIQFILNKMSGILSVTLYNILVGVMITMIWVRMSVPWYFKPSQYCLACKLVVIITVVYICMARDITNYLNVPTLTVIQ